jgi:hypothetical protein
MIEHLCSEYWISGVSFFNSSIPLLPREPSEDFCFDLPIARGHTEATDSWPSFILYCTGSFHWIIWLWCVYEEPPTNKSIGQNRCYYYKSKSRLLGCWTSATKISQDSANWNTDNWNSIECLEESYQIPPLAQSVTLEWWWADAGHCTYEPVECRQDYWNINWWEFTQAVCQAVISTNDDQRASGHTVAKVLWILTP